MVLISLLLFFLPLFNGLIGGFVGGYKVGGAMRAVAAALLPAVIVAMVLWVLLAQFALPSIGLFAGFAGGALIILADLGLLVGAFIGGLISHRGARER